MKSIQNLILTIKFKLGILKDVPDFPLVMVYIKERDAKRMALFPSLDYRGLYTVLIQLLEVAPLIQAGVDGTSRVKSDYT